LFAGSGALGLEALSRGAAEAVFVDKEPLIGRHLRTTIERLRIEAARVQVADALRFLRGPAEQFDIVFLDPPFASGVLPEVCERLAGGCGRCLHISNALRRRCSDAARALDCATNKRAGKSVIICSTRRRRRDRPIEGAMTGAMYPYVRSDDQWAL
jgi:16S rRNA G966 N2-methylase RsmD